MNSSSFSAVPLDSFFYIKFEKPKNSTAKIKEWQIWRKYSTKCRIQERDLLMDK